MKEDTSKQKNKNYILSNNVVINLGNLLQKRKQSKTSKPSQERQPSPVKGSTTFTNISNLETQTQQANLRNIEERGRFMNTSQFPSNSSSSSSSDNINPNIRKPSYYSRNDNAGAFGSIPGSDSFLAQGNNIPDTESNSTRTLEKDNDISSIQQPPNDIGILSEEEEYVLTPQAKTQTRSRYRTPNPTTYTKREIQIWLNSDKRINPKLPLNKPTNDGRQYHLIRNTINSKVFETLTKDAIYYGLL